MRILHLLDALNRGGLELLTLDMCRNAKRKNFDIILVSLGNGELKKDFIESGIKVVELKRRFPFDPFIIFKLRKIIRKENIKVIHSHQPVEGLHAFVASLGTNVKNVMSFHGHTPSRKDDIVRSFLIPRISANIGVSKAFLNRVSTAFNVSDNFVVIHNGVDTARFSNISGNIRSELNLPAESILLGMVGNFYNSGRDQLTICKALPALFCKYSEMHFLFIGGRSETYPHYFDDCYSFCKNNNILDRVHFLGKRTDVSSILKRLNGYVYSSNHDSFGISVIEAMISGLPVIINDLSSLMEVTGNGRYAYVFKTRNADSLTEKISYLLENPLESEKLKYLGKEWALKNYSIDNYIDNLKLLYSKLNLNESITRYNFLSYD